MGSWFTNPFKSKRSLSTESLSGTYGLTDDAFARILGLDTISANATPQTAMGIATFFGCVRFISDLIASQPFNLHKKLKSGGSETASDHPLYDLIHTRPNAQMSSFIARRTMVANLLVYGYAVAHIVRDEDNRPIAIKPYPSSKVSILEDPETGFNFFHITTASQHLILSEDDVIFLKDVSFDGTIGSGITKWQKKTIKTGLLIANYTEKYYEKGTFMSGFLTTNIDPKNKEAAKIYKERMVEAMQGNDTGGYGFAILGDGAAWHSVAQTPVESQIIPFLERGDKDICKFFGVSPAMIGDTEKQTSFGTGVEQSFIGVTNSVIIPKATQIEQEFDYKCLSARERKAGYYTKMNFRNLLKGDAKSYGEFIAKMVQIGAYNLDEVRAWDEMSPIEGGYGKEHYMQGAMVPLSELKKLISSKNQENGQRQTVSTSDN